MYRDGTHGIELTSFLTSCNHYIITMTGARCRVRSLPPGQRPKALHRCRADIHHFSALLRSRQQVDDVDIAVFNLDGEYFAIEDVCTHAFGVLTRECV